jgi:hypothetical protein
MPRIADDEISIRFGHETINLRPTLRAAFRLERRFEGFDHIIRGIAELNLTIIAEVIRETAQRPCDLVDYLDTLDEMPLRRGIGALVEPLITVALSLMGTDEVDFHNEPDEIDEARISFAEHHAWLFRVATGWLGWPPDTAWSATPAEIIEAYQGRVDMLNALFGSGEREKPNEVRDMDADVAAFFGSRERAS